MEQTYFDPSYLRTSVFPITDNTYDLGAAALAFRSAYLTTSLVFTSSFSILANTADGSDSRDLFLAGGGSTATDGSRGAWMRISGNESASVGTITMRTGSATGAYIILDVSSSDGAIALKNQNTQIVWITNLGMQLKLTDNQIYTGTSDGSDNAVVTINAGGAYNSGGSRGAFIRLYGNENATAGSLTLSAGSASSAYVALVAPASNGYFRYIINGTEEWSMVAGTTMIFTTASATIRSNTADGSDNLAIRIAAGGAYNQSGTRGGFIMLQGNEVGNGASIIGSGDASGASLSLSSPASNGYIRMQPGGSDEWLFFVGRDLAFGGGNAQIRAYSNDGTDNRYLLICGGGGSGSSRGAVVMVNGNEAQGYALMSGGAVSTGSIYFDLNHASASIFFRNTAGNAMWQITAAGALTQAATNGTDIVFNTTGTAIRFGTSDGSDNKYLTVCGGGAYGNGRGSSLLVTGNEEAGHGSAELMLGNLTDSHFSVRLFNSSAVFRVQNNASTLWSIDGAGTLLSDASNGGGLILARSGANVTPIISGASSLDADLTFRIGTHASLVTVQSSAVGTVVAHCSYAADASGNIIDYLKSREASGSAANTIVANNDVIAQFRFWGADGATFQSAARIQVVVDGTPGVSDMPGRIELWVTADGASSPTKSWVLGNDRVVFMANCVAAPGTPAGGGYLYTESGALKYKGSSGTVTPIAPA